MFLYSDPTCATAPPKQSSRRLGPRFLDRRNCSASLIDFLNQNTQSRPMGDAPTTMGNLTTITTEGHPTAFTASSSLDPRARGRELLTLVRPPS